MMCSPSRSRVRIALPFSCHLVDKRSGTTGTDTVHTLFDVAALKVNDLGVLTAELDGNIGLRSECF